MYRSLEHEPDQIISPDKRLIKNLQSPSPGNLTFVNVEINDIFVKYSKFQKLIKVIIVSGEAITESRRAYIKSNCLNHHPYGTFYYNKKSGRTGKHYYYK